jgi:hypothetical protein
MKVMSTNHKENPKLPKTTRLIKRRRKEEIPHKLLEIENLAIHVVLFPLPLSSFPT